MYKRSQTWTGILDAERINQKSKTTRELTNSQDQQSVHTTLENDRCKWTRLVPNFTETKQNELG